MHDPYADDDPYAEFKRGYEKTTGALAEMPVVTVPADTVARAVVRAIEAKDPKPRYLVGVSGKGLCARPTAPDRPDVGSDPDEGPEALEGVRHVR